MDESYPPGLTGDIRPRFSGLLFKPRQRPMRGSARRFDPDLPWRARYRGLAIIFVDKIVGAFLSGVINKSFLKDFVAIS